MIAANRLPPMTSLSLAIGVQVATHPNALIAKVANEDRRHVYNHQRPVSSRGFPASAVLAFPPSDRHHRGTVVESHHSTGPVNMKERARLSIVNLVGLRQERDEIGALNLCGLTPPVGWRFIRAVAEPAGPRSA